MPSLHSRFLVATMMLSLLGCTGLIDGPGEPPDINNSNASGRARVGAMYFVPGFTATWATTDWNRPEVRAGFQRDLVIMAALGIRNVKLALEPAFSGLAFNQNTPQLVPTTLAAAQAATPEIVRRLSEVGIATALTFMTNSMYLRSGSHFNDPSVPNDYEIAYGNLGLPAGPQRMAADLYGWETSLIASVTGQGLTPALDYINMATEVSYSYQRAGGVRWDQVSPHVVQPLASMPAIPGGKRAADVLFQGEATSLARDVAAVGAHLDVTEVHTYVGSLGGVNGDIGRAVSEARAAFPGTRVVIGEFGAELCDNGGDEIAQAQAFLHALDEADQHGVDLLLNWGLWDYDDQGCPNSSGHWGFGYSVDRPRNALGRLVERQSALPNGNFEPDLVGWSAGGSTSAVSLIHGGPSRADAATNQRYLRLQASAPGTYYACSPAFAIDGSKVAVSAYVRSTSQKLSVAVQYRNGAGWSTAPVIVEVPGTGRWEWRNVQSLLGGVIHQLPAVAQEAIVCFAMDAGPTASSNAPAYLDVDTLAVNASR